MKKKIIQLKTNSGENVYPISNNDTVNNADVRLPRVYIISENLIPHADTNIIDGLNTIKNEVPCTIKLVGKDISFEDTGVIAYQGATSINAPKKGFSIDTNKKHRFSTWVEMDSFHLKAYYTDWTHCRDLVCNRIYEQMMNLHIFNPRPFMIANDFNNDYRQCIEGGAMCHIDGFPCELYINDVYWGLYSWNIKKNRDNYLQNKKNTNHIQLEMAEFTNLNSNFSWTTVEIRNPKSDSGNSSFEEGVEPNAGEVKTSWTNFINFMNSITINTSKVSIEEHLNITSFIDSLLLSDMACIWDSFVHNSLFTTWDGIIYSILLYDMDLTWGVENDFKTTYPQGNALVSPTYRTFYRNTTDAINNRSSVIKYCSWFSILINIYSNEINSKYAELRKHIFTEENIVSVFNKLTQEIGYDVYKNDLTRWTYPSYTDINDGTKRVAEWVKQRLSYLDNKYNYNI